MPQPRGYVLFGLAALLLATPAFADGDFNFIYGERSLDDDVWEPVEDQEVFGVTVDFGGENWPINIALGYYESQDEGELANFPILGPVDLEGTVSEWSVGIYKKWEAGSARPFLGGGVSFVDAEAEVESILGSANDSDSSNGVYLEGGIFWRLGSVFNIGLHGRIVEATDVTVFDVEGDADYYQIGALIGFGWK